MSLQTPAKKVKYQVAKFIGNVALSSLPRFILWRLQRSTGETELTLKSGVRVLIRSGTHDNAVADEIFVRSQYAPPPQVELKNIKTIVDVGANVGFASLYLLNRFPQASVTAFEPHPDHIAQIHKHIGLNRLKDRLALVEAAAGTCVGTVQFLDDGCCSATVTNCGEGTTKTENIITVPVVDLFQELPDGVIDILKIDAEGAEYDIMADARFSEVAARSRFIVMEWHNTDAHVDGRAWCAENLEKQGFTLYDGNVQYGIAGFLWAASKNAE